MTLLELKEHLKNANHSKDSRHLYSLLILENETLFPKLFTIAQEIENPISYRAMWVLEFVCRKNLFAILPFLSVFVETIKKVHLQSGIRPAAKICEYLIVAYYSDDIYTTELKQKLTPSIRKQITACCFDWLIDTKTKVAPKAYSMTTLYLLGKDFKWIHTELKLILEQNYPQSSAAYKARARMVLAKLKV